MRARPRSHSDGAGARPGAALDLPRRLRGQDQPRLAGATQAPRLSPRLASPRTPHFAAHLTSRAPHVPSHHLTSRRSSRLQRLATGGASRHRPSTGPAPCSSSREKSRPRRGRGHRIAPPRNAPAPSAPPPGLPGPCHVAPYLRLGATPPPAAGRPAPFPAANPVRPGARCQRAAAAARVLPASTCCLLSRLASSDCLQGILMSRPCVALSK